MAVAVKTKGVRATHPDYDRMLPQWLKCRDLEQGQRAVHEAGERYLPRLTDETDMEYKARRDRSDFFNCFYRTINGLVGMAFRKDPEVILPASIEPFVQNIDMAGMTLVGMTKDACEDVMQYGRVFLLVDHPPAPENVSAISQAIAEQLGMRPALQMYDALSVINWRHQVIGNAKVLTRVVLKEQAWLDKDEWEQEAEERYRVLDIETGAYRQRVFRVNDKGEDELLDEVYPMMGGRPLSFIPGKFIDPNGMGGKVDEPPLIDLADKNVAHFQVNSDYRHGGHYTALPTLFLSGMEPPEGGIRIGGNAAFTSPQPDARGQYIEYTGSGLGALEKQLERIEHQMAVLGAQAIIEQVVTKTATEAAMNKSGEHSVMASLAIAVSDAFTWALKVMAAWVGATGEVSFEISREFNPLGLSPQALTAYMSAVQQGLLSEREFFALCQKGDIVDAEKDFETHQEEINQDGPKLLTLDQRLLADKAA